MEIRSTSSSEISSLAILPDGRPDFAANPFNGPWPGYEQLVQRFCSNAQVPGCVRQDTGGDNLAPPPAYATLPYSHQVSIGLERQLANTLAIEADYVFTGGRDERYVQNNVNITFDPATTQSDFEMFSRVIAQSIYATPVQPARASGVLGFDVGIAATVVRVDTDASYWQNAVHTNGDFTHIVDLEHAWNLLRHQHAAEALAIFERLEQSEPPKDKHAFDAFWVAD